MHLIASLGQWLGSQSGLTLAVVGVTGVAALGTAMLTVSLVATVLWVRSLRTFGLGFSA